MRATRNFSGRAAAGTKQFNGRPPGYARELLAKRQEGKRIGLLLVAVDDWEGGWYFRDKPNVSRIVCMPDLDIAAANRVDWGGLQPDIILTEVCRQLERFTRSAR